MGRVQSLKLRNKAQNFYFKRETETVTQRCLGLDEEYLAIALVDTPTVVSLS